MPKGYTDITSIENYILQTIDPTFYSQINDWIAGIEKYIDLFTERNFIADEEASARIFDGNGSNTLIIPDCTEIQTVCLAADSFGSSFSEVPSTGSDRYIAYPREDARTVSDEIIAPATQLLLTMREFLSGYGTVKINARWGYSDVVPADIKFAATVFVSGIINQSRQGGEAIKSEKIGNYQVTYNTDKGDDSFADFEKAKDILENYIRYSL